MTNDEIRKALARAHHELARDGAVDAIVEKSKGRLRGLEASLFHELAAGLHPVIVDMAQDLGLAPGEALLLVLFGLTSQELYPFLDEG